MTLRDAIIKRIAELCAENGRSVGDFCLSGGMSPSTYYDFANNRTKLPKVDTIKSICQGAGISMSEFFARDYFDDYEEK